MDKWQFVPDKECYYCEEELTDEDYKKEICVTKCVHCKRSFVD